MDILDKIKLTEAKAKILEVELNKQVLGQSHVFPQIISYMKRGEAGLTSPKVPKGSFISLGPTGVGKTETIKVIVSEFFDNNPHALVRLNMSEYKTIADMQQFLGTPERKGFLQAPLEEAGEAGRILLFDELEKGHPEMQDLLLQILDEAYIQFQNGDSFSFKNWYIWATSNIGSDMATRGKNPSIATMSRAFRSELAKKMRPEIVERWNCVLTYMRLSTDSQVFIAELLIKNEIQRLNEICHSDFKIECLESLTTYAQQHGYTKALGARRMRKVVHEALQAAYYSALVDGDKIGNIKADMEKIYICTNGKEHI